MTAPQPIISLQQVSKSFGKSGAVSSYIAVDRLDLAIGRGQMLALLGKTGCGKSTIFNMIAGLTEPTSGQVTVDGRNPFRDFDSFRGKIAIVFQGDRLLPWRTAVQNVELGLEMLDVPAAERRETAMRWLSTLGLRGHEHDYPHALSGGMRQRVSIARAFAGKPSLLLCDEPFSALDEHTGDALRREFRDLLRETGATSIFITHSIDEALQLGERLMVFERPARIAFETKLPAGMSEAERAAVAGRIREVLAGEIAA
jgi:NitT/TauT family transport system ATP-binding protein